MENERPRRFFVRITVPDEQRLPALMSMDLDLFGEHTNEAGRQIDGFVTLEEVEKLVDAGFIVQMWDTPPEQKRERKKYIEFDEWRKEMLSDLKQQQQQKR